MDNIVRTNPSGLLSHQVTGARYFFLELAPRRAAPMTLAMGGRESCNPDYAIHRWHFPFYGLEYVVSGQGWVELDGRKQPLGPGAIFAYGPTTR